MEKLAFLNLQIEITRRCNIRCAHCMKGDAQSVVLEKAVIDKLLDKTVAIGTLHITGGEPFADVDIMRYLIDGIVDRDIPVNNLLVTTNGLLIDDSCRDIFKKIYSHLKVKHELVYKKEMPAEWLKSKCVVRVSVDKFHGTDKDDIYKKVNSILGEYTEVKLYGIGDVVKAIGRGKDIDNSAKVGEYKRHKIQIQGHGRMALCPYVSNELSQKETDKYIICCSINLTAKGNLEELFDNDYNTEDQDANIIANVLRDDSIIKMIDSYNTKIPFCDYIEKQNIDESDPTTLIFEKRIAENRNETMNDKRYWTQTGDLSDESKLSEYAGNSLNEKMADYLNVNRVLSVGEVFARKWFPDDPKSQEIKIAYPYLSREECLYYQKAPDEHKTMLRIMNGERKVKADLEEHKKANKRLFLMFENLRKMVRDGMPIDKAYDLYTVNMDRSRGMSLKFDQEKFIDYLHLESNYDKWGAIKGFFVQKMMEIVENINLESIRFMKSEQCSIENYKAILGEYIAIFRLWDSYKKDNYSKEYQADKNDKFTKALDEAALVFPELLAAMMQCDIILEKMVNSVDDFFKRDHTYTDREATFKEAIIANNVTNKIKTIQNELRR